MGGPVVGVGLDGGFEGVRSVIAAGGVRSTYPLRVFSATSLSASARAFSAVGKVLVCVCPAEPTLP